MIYERGLLFLSVIIFSPYIYAQEEIIILKLDKPIMGIDSEKASSLSALAALLKTNEPNVDSQIKYYYENLKNKQEILTDKYSLDYLNSIEKDLQNLCEKNPTQKMKKNQKNSEPVIVSSQVLAILAITQLACESLGKSNDLSLDLEESDDILKKTGILPGTNVGADPTLSKDFKQNALQGLNMSGKDYDEEMTNNLNSLNKNGFIEVNSDSVPNIDKTYAKYGKSLKPITDIVGKLSFQSKLATTPLKDSVALGSETAGVTNDSGASSVVQIYNNEKLGKFSIEETDLVSQNSVIYQDPSFLNVQVGTKKASLTVLKGQDSDKYSTEIFWMDDDLKKSFTVKIDKNLNAPENASLKNEVLKDLSVLAD